MTLDTTRNRWNFLRRPGSNKKASAPRRSSSGPEREREIPARRMASMETRKEEQGAAVGWMTVPTFGDWDMKNGPVPDYSMDFSKIREMRKQNKRELSRASLGGDDDLLAQQQKATQQPQLQPGKAGFASSAADDPHHADQDDSPTGRKKFLSYFQCCTRA